MVEWRAARRVALKDAQTVEYWVVQLVDLTELTLAAQKVWCLVEQLAVQLEEMRVDWSVAKWVVWMVDSWVDWWVG